MNPANKLVSKAAEWMRHSAVIAMRHYARPGNIMTKDDKSPLTEADLEIDRYLHRQLSGCFPEIPVVTEERAHSHVLDVSSGMFFLVDPIDGTKEFINKRDEFTVNIALVEDGIPVAGVVCAPALDIFFAGIAGQGAKETSLESGKSRSIKCRVPDNNALHVVASRSHLTAETEAFIKANKVAGTKNAGSSLKFCLLAKGEADLYPRFGPTMEWDTAAGHAVLTAAGGKVQNLDGSPLRYAKREFRNPHFMASAHGTQFVIPDME